MTTVLNIRKIPRNKDYVRRKEVDDHGSVEASLDVTLSMSQTSNREEISWSSSDGSTYYSDDDEMSLKHRRYARQASRPKEHHDIIMASSKSKKDDVKIIHDDKKQSQIMNCVETRSNPNKRKSMLENVDRFPAIDMATSSEEMSAVGFLTTEDTANVFCTSNVPFEVATAEKFSFEISAISSASTDDSSVLTSCSRSDVAVRHYQHKRTASKSGRATVNSQFTGLSSGTLSIPPINEHSVDLVSITNQEPVSSLEYETTWDDLSLDSDSSSDSGSNGDRNREMDISTPQKTRDLPVKTPTQIPSLPLNITPKVTKIKQMEREKSETDERIQQLKAKIKSIQEQHCSDSTVNHSDDVSSTQIESFISMSSSSQRRVHQETIMQKSHNDTDTSTPLIRKCLSGESQERKESNSTEEKDQSIAQEHDQVIDESLWSTSIPLMIPVVEREEISIMEFDGMTRNDVVLVDVEAGRLTHEPSMRNTKDLSPSKKGKSKGEKIKSIAEKSKAKVLAAYDYVLPIIARKKIEFEQKPRSEQIIMTAIAVLSFIFIILLLVMMVQ